MHSGYSLFISIALKLFQTLLLAEVSQRRAGNTSMIYPRLVSDLVRAVSTYETRGIFAVRKRSRALSFLDPGEAPRGFES